MLLENLVVFRISLITQYQKCLRPITEKSCHISYSFMLPTLDALNLKRKKRKHLSYSWELSQKWPFIQETQSNTFTIWFLLIWTRKMHFEKDEMKREYESNENSFKQLIVKIVSQNNNFILRPSVLQNGKL